MRLVLLSFFLIFTLCVHQNIVAQSAVYIFQNLETGKGDYMFRYGMANEDSAKNLAYRQIVELGYDSTLVKPLASTPEKGYGLIVRSYYRNKKGINVTVYGASLGQPSYEDAEGKAIDMIIDLYPAWDEELYDYNVIQYFYDEEEKEN